MNIAPGQKRYLNSQYLGQGLPDKDISFPKYKTPLLHCAAEKKTLGEYFNGKRGLILQRQNWPSKYLIVYKFKLSISSLFIIVLQGFMENLTFN